MSDLDTSLRDLREGLRSTVTKPGLDKIADRARHRSVRRRMQIGAIVAVVLVSVAVPLLRSLPDPTPPATPPTPPTTRSVPYAVEFVDRTHAYALGRRCPGALDPCRFTLLATADTGRTWEKRSMPDGKYADGSLAVQSPSTVVFYTTTTSDENFIQAYISRDGGRKWARYDLAVPALGAPSSIPPDVPIQVICTNGGRSGCLTGLGTLGSDDRLHPVPVQPPVYEPWPGRYPTPSGVYWAVGRDQAGHWAVSVTDRKAAAWTTTPLDVPGAIEPPNAWSVVEGDGSLYLTAVGSIGGGTTKLLAVYRSKDRGRTWTQTRRAQDTGAQMSMYGTPVATSDGRLLVNSLPEGTLESRDGGATFTRAAHQLPGSPEWTPAGYVIQLLPTSYEVSWNGRDWRRFEVS